MQAIGHIYNLIAGETPAKEDTDQVVTQKGFYNAFLQLSDAQTSIVEKQSVLAATYMIAGIFFGFPGIFTLNPISFVRCALLLILGLAIGRQVVKRGPVDFAKEVVSQVKSYISSFNKKSLDDKSAGKPVTGEA